MEIKKILPNEKADALRLVWRVFLEFEAPDYTQEGIEAFRKFLQSEEAVNGLELFGAYENGKMLGVIATRNEGNHITLLFVDGKHHRRGIGRKLFKVVVKNSTAEVITVNSSPYAIEVYHKLGFVDTDTEKIKEGIRFTPMKYQK